MKDLFENIWKEILKTFFLHYQRKPNEEELKVLRTYAIAGTGLVLAVKEIRANENINH
jgi:hypothetical protein